MLKFITSWFLAAFLTVAPIQTDKQITKLVRWAGCQADVVTSDEHSVLESFSLGDKLYIGTEPTPGLTKDMETMVIFHEVAHCLQYQHDAEGFEMGYSVNPKEYELAADREGARLMCAMHLDGPKANHDLLVYAYKEFGYTGDVHHGSLVERMHQSDNLDTCTKFNEAP
jgi:hypothetical protein